MYDLYGNDEYDDRFSHTATEAEAHAEWHRNSGVPMGTPGCPQDACHPDPDYDDDYDDAPVLSEPGELPPPDPDDLPF